MPDRDEDDLCQEAHFFVVIELPRPMAFHDWLKPLPQQFSNCSRLLRYATKKRQAIPMTWRTLRKGPLSLVTIGISVEGDGIYNSLVVHQLVPFVIGEGVELIAFRIPDNLVGFDELRLAWFLLRLLEFVQDILTHDVIIQLRFAFAVEAEASDFAFDFAFLCGVTIILGTSRHKFHNVVVVVQFTRKTLRGNCPRPGWFDPCPPRK